MQKGLNVITLQGAIKKNKIMLSQYLKKMNDWMSPQLFRFMVVAIIFSLTVHIIFVKRELNIPYFAKNVSIQFPSVIFFTLSLIFFS